MSKNSEHLAILRCQTWNVWPERTGVEYQSIFIDFNAEEPLRARLIVVSYDQRTLAERYEDEETKLGPLVWNGDIYGLHKVRNTVLKAPEDTVEITMQHRHTRRGEVDIFINFMFEDELPPSLIESLRATALSVLALVNLKLNDYLVPTAPFQIRKVLSEGQGQLESGVLLTVRNRSVLSSDILKPTLSAIANVLVKSKYGVKLRTALELYAAHFTEQQVRVRFLLLVIALESLAKPTMKHDTAIDLLACWQKEIESKMSDYIEDSEEYKSLESLSRELSFRSEDSLRSQIRKLFINLPGFTEEQTNNIQRRALRVYDKRSVLVHEGELPDDELNKLEDEARELLVKLFSVAIDQEKPRVEKTGSESN